MFAKQASLKREKHRGCQFSDIEKQVINLLLEYHDKLQYNCLYNIFFDFKGLIGTPTEIIMKHSEKDKTELYFRDILHKQPDELRALQLDICEKILSTVELIDRLISEKFIALVKNSNPVDHDSGDPSYVAFNILDEKMQARIYELSNGYFIPYRKLYVLKERQYQTEEDRKENRAFRLNIAVLMSSAILTVATIINMCFVTKVKIVNDEIIHKIISMWHFPIPW